VKFLETFKAKDGAAIKKELTRLQVTASPLYYSQA